MKVVKLEDIEKLRCFAQLLRDKAAEYSDEFTHYRLGIDSNHIEMMTDRLEDLAFEIDELH